MSTPENQGLLALQIILQKISTGDNEGVNRNLDLIQIDKLSPDRADSLLSRLLTTALQYSNDAIVRDIIVLFEPNFTDLYRLPVLNRILLNLRFEDDVVSFVLRQYPELSYEELALNYIRGEDDDNILTGLSRLDSNRGPLNEEDYRSLYNESVLKGNDAARTFFAHQLDTRSSFAPIPTWVHNYTEFEDIPYLDEIEIPNMDTLTFPLPESIDDMVDVLTAGLRSDGKTSEEVDLAQMEVRKTLITATPDERAELLRSNLESKARLRLADDEDLFAIFGPANAIFDTELDDSTRLCDRYGGCRMLCCIDFETFVDPDEDIVYDRSEYTSTDWFTGSCQQCHLRILRPAHAIRMPLEHGGWQGCYCSEKCLKDAMPRDNLIVVGLVDRVLLELERIGIQDRLERVPKQD